MTSVEPGTVKRRRRGADLERALLTAAWDELTEAGFAKLTMESVADRAKTGVAVLYRRWTDKSDLVLAAIRHYRDLNPVVIPDTGDLREDMLALLGDINTRREDIATLVGATFAGLHDSAGLTPEDIVLSVLGDGPRRTDAVFHRAHERGEIDLTQIPEDVLALPFQLLRHDILMTLQPASSERIQSIVDDIFRPLVMRYNTAAGNSAQRASPKT
ncbi:TetR/AcrR family transcriptional regulator [Catenuloplanes atrovinosus]|uniref:AcrR family transcriptional regulator n=1 Tax=Catenuloplanes atrovinosus TaxID=137266 RepID=A0AAE3YJF1_9ACTN|nr:TetR/AcrR family transcriptional regulator [Catenuloplanes atrovinosus]MDR7273587.1 AcrR family transcriptional regulator [Catenuloplanes atrovinosus]